MDKKNKCFSKYLNSNGTDFSGLRNVQMFADMSPADALEFYREYLAMKMQFITPSTVECDATRVEMLRVVGGKFTMDASTLHGVKEFFVRLDDCKLPLLLKDREYHLKQQLGLIYELYEMMLIEGSISEEFLEEAEGGISVSRKFYAKKVAKRKAGAGHGKLAQRGEKKPVAGVKKREGAVPKKEVSGQSKSERRVDDLKTRKLSVAIGTDEGGLDKKKLKPNLEGDKLENTTTMLVPDKPELETDQIGADKKQENVLGEEMCSLENAFVALDVPKETAIVSDSSKPDSENSSLGGKDTDPVDLLDKSTADSVSKIGSPGKRIEDEEDYCGVNPTENLDINKERQKYYSFADYLRLSRFINKHDRKKDGN